MLISSNQKKIVQLLADGKFHSGTELAEKIGVSRSAISKQLKNLSEIGLLEFNAISGRGYQLDSAIQFLSEESIKKKINSATDSLITELEIYDVIDSTNNYLVEKAQNTSESGTVCLAEYQTAGKGRRGRRWVSPFGSNIYLSILWSFQNGPAVISGLSLAVGTAVIRALKECGIDHVGLKWPNDIYWNDKKLAGILIEVSGEASGPCYAVIGLGLNIYLQQKKAQSITQDWVDLTQIMGEKANTIRNKLVATLLNQLMPVIANFEQKGLQHYLDEWRLYDCMQGKQVDIFMGQQQYSGTIEGIDNNGLLLLTGKDGVQKTFASGEVSFCRT